MSSCHAQGGYWQSPAAKGSGREVHLASVESVENGFRLLHSLQAVLQGRISLLANAIIQDLKCSHSERKCSCLEGQKS